MLHLGLLPAESSRSYNAAHGPEVESKLPSPDVLPGGCLAGIWLAEMLAAGWACPHVGA